MELHLRKAVNLRLSFDEADAKYPYRISLDGQATYIGAITLEDALNHICGHAIAVSMSPIVKFGKIVVDRSVLEADLKGEAVLGSIKET